MKLIVTSLVLFSGALMALPPSVGLPAQGTQRAVQPIAPAAGGCTPASGDEYNESFEGTGAPASWTTGAGTPDYDAAVPGTSPCSGLGSQTLRCNVASDNSYVNALYDQGSGTQSDRYFRFYIYINARSLTANSFMSLMAVEDGSVNRAIQLLLYNTTGTYGFRIFGGDLSAAVDFDVQTWYRIELKFVYNGTSEMNVFNAAGAQVGSTVTCATGGGTPYQKIRLGPYSDNDTSTGDAYFDGLGVSTTGYIGQ